MPNDVDAKLIKTRSEKESASVGCFFLLTKKNINTEIPTGKDTTSERNRRNEIANFDPEFRFGISSKAAPLRKPTIKRDRNLLLFAEIRRSFLESSTTNTTIGRNETACKKYSCSELSPEKSKSEVAPNPMSTKRALNVVMGSRFLRIDFTENVVSVN